MEVQTALPSVPLRSYVRRYIRHHFDARQPSGILPQMPIYAGPSSALFFFLDNDFRTFEKVSGKELFCQPISLINGQNTFSRVEHQIYGVFTVFFIEFQPTGFFQLFNIPMSHFTDTGVESDLVLGKALNECRERLGEADNFAKQVEVLESWLFQHLQNARTLSNGINEIARNVLFDAFQLPVYELAKQACLSPRQFERRFFEAVGVSPKIFASMARFRNAVFLQMAQPQRTWTEIAHICGYADQMHFIRHFKRFTGITPSQWAQQNNLNPFVEE